MPYHSNEKKEKKKEVKPIKGLTVNQSKKLREHSKSHKGGMMSKHIKNMSKFMKNGDSFSVAHKKAVKADKSP